MNKYNKVATAAVILAVIGTASAETVAAANDGLSDLGKGLAVGLGAIGTGIAQSRIGGGAVGAIAEDPSKFGTMLILLLIPETLVIFGLLAFFLM